MAKTEYRIGGGAWTTYTAPLPVTSSGTVEYRSTDVRGNVEPARTQELRVDAAAPVSTATLDPAAGPYTGPVTVRLAATDAGSGVSRIEYSLDDGATWVTYATAPVIAAVGAHSVRHRAVDVAGNVETARSVSFTIAAPTATPTVTPTVTATPTVEATPTATATPDTRTPLPAPSATPTPTPQPGPVVSTAVRPRVKAAGKAVKVTLSCPAGATCSGTVALQVTVKRKAVSVGKATFSLTGGQSRTLTVKLNAAGAKRLRGGAQRVTVVTAAKAADGKAKTYRSTVTLKRAR